MAKDQTQITNRELYLLLATLGPEVTRLRQAGKISESDEVQRLWLKLEEQWDALPSRERNRATR